jgi:hypothetical protein
MSRPAEFNVGSNVVKVSKVVTIKYMFNFIFLLLSYSV